MTATKQVTKVNKYGSHKRTTLVGRNDSCDLRWKNQSM